MLLVVALNMWQQHVRAWITFRRSERLGIALLVLLVGLTWLIPVLFSRPQSFEEVYRITAVQIDSAVHILQSQQNRTRDAKKIPSRSGSSFLSRAPRVALDINEADSAAWERLPGIGEKLSSRIVRYRERLGGFVAVEQVKEVYGLRDSVFFVLSDRLVVEPGFVPKRLLLNAVDYPSLRRHPYVSHELAKALLAYRKAHVRFSSTQELYELVVADSAEIKRLLPYVEID